MTLKYWHDVTSEDSPPKLTKGLSWCCLYRFLHFNQYLCQTAASSAGQVSSGAHVCEARSFFLCASLFSSTFPPARKSRLPWSKDHFGKEGYKPHPAESSEPCVSFYFLTPLFSFCLSFSLLSLSVAPSFSLHLSSRSLSPPLSLLSLSLSISNGVHKFWFYFFLWMVGRTFFSTFLSVAIPSSFWFSTFTLSNALCQIKAGVQCNYDCSPHPSPPSGTRPVAPWWAIFSLARVRKISWCSLPHVSTLLFTSLRITLVTDQIGRFFGRLNVYCDPQPLHWKTITVFSFKERVSKVQGFILGIDEKTLHCKSYFVLFFSIVIDFSVLFRQFFVFG